MRSATGSLLLIFMALACATSTNAPPADVELRVEQLPDAGFAVQDRGAVSIAYQMTVKNRTASPITLKKIEMRTTGSSPYTLRNAPVDLNETIGPEAEAVVSFTMWCYQSEQRSAVKKMVWVNGVAYFESANGSVRKEFAQSFREP